MFTVMSKCCYLQIPNLSVVIQSLVKYSCFLLVHKISSMFLFNTGEEQQLTPAYTKAERK